MFHHSPSDQSPSAVTDPELASPPVGSGSERPLRTRQLNEREVQWLDHYLNGEPVYEDDQAAHYLAPRSRREPWVRPVPEELRDDSDPLGPARGVFNGLLFTLIIGGGIGLLWMGGRVIQKWLGL